jgi:hypothetical protein
MQSYRFRAVVKEEPEPPSRAGANTIWKCCDIQVFAPRELLNNGVEKGLIGHGRQVAYLPVPIGDTLTVRQPDKWHQVGSDTLQPQVALVESGIPVQGNLGKIRQRLDPLDRDRDQFF